MKKQYIKPISDTVRVETASIIATSLWGGELGSRDLIDELDDADVFSLDDGTIDPDAILAP